MVVDTTPPVLSNLPNLTIEATSTAGAVVTYATPSASDVATAHPAVTCFPPSGSQFPLGVNMVAVTAVDAAGNTATTTFTVTVTTPPNLPVITSPSTAIAQLGSAFRYQITATNTPTTFAATGLPLGLTLDRNSGAITGTVAMPIQTAVTVTAANVGGSGSAIVTITIAPGIAFVHTSGTAVKGMGQLGVAVTIPVPLAFTVTAGVALGTGTTAVTGQSPYTVEPGDDLTLSTPIISVPPGATTASIVFTLIDNRAIHPQGQLANFVLTGPLAGTPAAFALTILDHQPLLVTVNGRTATGTTDLGVVGAGSSLDVRMVDGVPPYLITATPSTNATFTYVTGGLFGQFAVGDADGDGDLDPAQQLLQTIIAPGPGVLTIIDGAGATVSRRSAGDQPDPGGTRTFRWIQDGLRGALPRNRPGTRTAAPRAHWARQHPGAALRVGRTDPERRRMAAGTAGRTAGAERGLPGDACGPPPRFLRDLGGDVHCPGPAPGLESGRGTAAVRRQRALHHARLVGLPALR
jgi:hypothetical protein